MTSEKKVDPVAESILDTYTLNTWLANTLAGDLNHDDSLIQLPFPANCLNWVVGHVITGRCTGLVLLDLEPVWGEDLRSRYKTGSTPILDGSDAVRFEEMLKDLELSQTRFAGGLMNATRRQLEQLRETDRGEKKVGDHLTGLAWHETFHIGQIDMLVSYIISIRETESIKPLIK